MGKNDVVFVHLLPYWNVDIPAPHSVGIYDLVQKEFRQADREAGSAPHGGVEASVANRAYFVRGFVQLA